MDVGAQAHTDLENAIVTILDLNGGDIGDVQDLVDTAIDNWKLDNPEEDTDDGAE